MRATRWLLVWLLITCSSALAVEGAAPGKAEGAKAGGPVAGGEPATVAEPGAGAAGGEAGAGAGASPALRGQKDIPDLSLPSAQSPASTEELGYGWMLLRTMVVLGVVVLLAYLVLNVGLRRLLGVQAPAGSRGIVEVVERLQLDPKRVVFVIKVGSDYFLVGGGDQGLSLLSKLDPVEIEKLRARPSQRVTLSPFLEKLLSRRTGTPPPPA